jgi:hypothetical protein
LADVAEVTGLTGACSDALAGLRQRRGVHDPGRVAVDLAVMLADGGEAIVDVAVLRDQPGLFGKVASDATAWRVPEGTRFIVRRERPHPGGRLSLFDTVEGMRHQVMATDTPPGHGSVLFLDACHRAHARVEDRIVRHEVARVE